MMRPWLWFSAFSLLPILFLSAAAAADAPGYSSLEQRTSYNSEKQLTYSLSGVWGFAESTFATAAFTHSRTVLTSIGEIDTFYHGTLGAGYSHLNLGLDAGFTISHSPLTRVNAYGGYIGLTYVHVPPDAEAEHYTDQALGLLHSQLYPENKEAPPLFWIRTAFVFNSLSSRLLGSGTNTGRETTFTFDFFYPYSDEILLGAGASFHGYEDKSGLFNNASKDLSTINMQLLGATVQGLPSYSYSLFANWQIAMLDTFTPRYQVTEIKSSSRLVHTFNFGWKHKFSKTWQIHPIYEITLQETQSVTGFLLGITYAF